MRNDEITYERTFQGAHRFTTVVNGYLFTRQYVFFTKREALAFFRAEVRAAKRLIN